MLKNIKWTALFLSIGYMAVGILLILYPQASANVICDVIGYAMIISGAINMITYFTLDLRSSLFRNDFLVGIVTALFGILVINQKQVFQSIIPFLLALIIVASGFSKIQDAIDAKRLGYSRSWIYVVLALISVAFGLFIMFGKINGNDVLFITIGVGLLYSGASDLFATIYLSTRIKTFIKRLDELEKQATMRQSDNVIDAEVQENISDHHA